MFSSHLLSFDLSFGELNSRGRQTRRSLAGEKARRIFQPVPTFFVGISLSDWLDGGQSLARMQPQEGSMPQHRLSL